jgi:hypothetical protein
MPMTFGPDGNLYVGNRFLDLGVSGDILRYDGMTGAFIDTFVEPGSGGLILLNDFTFGPDGNLYVASSTRAAGPDTVLRYDGRTGAFIDIFIPSGSDGLEFTDSLAFGPDGNLYLNSRGLGATGIQRYDGRTGAFLGTVVPGPGGKLLFTPGAVAVPETSTGLLLFIDAFVLCGRVRNRRSARDLN